MNPFPTSSRSRRATLSALAAVVWSTVGRADPAPVALRYTATAGCPDEAAFRARLASRLSTPLDAWFGRWMLVDAAADPHRAHGTLVVVDRNGTAARRDVEGATCDEVVSALALMAVVLLEGTGDRRESGTSPVPARSSEAPGPRPLPAASPQQPTPVRQDSSVQWAAGLQGVVVGGVAP